MLILKMKTLSLVLFAALITSSNVFASEQRGQLLYENHCRICHDSSVHIREKQKAKNIEDIMSWVNRWRSHLELPWNKQEITDVADYLNESFYHFAPTNKK